MTQTETTARVLETGTVMVKAIPPRLVQPYLTGQRPVIAGYVYRERDCTAMDPAGFFQLLRLGYQGSDFSPTMAELFVLRWPALDLSSSLVPLPPGNAPEPGGGIPEFFILPIPIPVGAEVHRVTPAGQELIARYDGQVWLPMGRPL